MADPSLFRLRVMYRKSGRLALLSHLEIARALERAVRRAGLPFAVSQGFSPHMRIAFGAALPVGVGGEAEFFDLFLTHYVPDAVALEALQEASPSDLMPYAARYVEHKAAAASVACPVSVYRVVFSEAPTALVVPETVTVTRKKKEKVLDVAEYLVEAPRPVEAGEGVGDSSVAPTGRDDRAVPQGAVFEFALEAKPTGSLRPDAFVQACIDATVAAGAASAGLQVERLTRMSQR